MKTPLTDVDENKLIDGLNFQQYCDNKARVRKDAIAAGCLGDEYKHYVTKRGMYTGKVVIKHHPLNNLHLYEFAKHKYKGDY